MPFGPYADWAECIADQQGKGDPEKICGALKARLEKAEGVLYLSRDEVAKLCPSCAERMDVLKMTHLKVATDPEPEFTVAKLDEERQLVFGWASMSKRRDGTFVLDKQGDMIAPDVLEDAAYDFVLHSREGDEMHTAAVKSQMVESFMVTPDKLQKMGLAADALPIGWWVGFHVNDRETFGKVKAGQYRMFSIGGEGRREAA